MNLASWVLLTFCVVAMVGWGRAMRGWALEMQRRELLEERTGVRTYRKAA